MSRLDARSAHLDTCRIADERVRTSGIRITALSELGTDEHLLQGIWEFERRTSRDIPGDLETA